MCFDSAVATGRHTPNQHVLFLLLLMYRMNIDVPYGIQVARAARVVAVLGIKTEKQARQPAFFVPEFLQQQCQKRIIPVPVYFPDATTILGEHVVRDLKEIREQVDILDIFRPSAALDYRLMQDILDMNPRPKIVWLQVGIRNEHFEKSILEAGIDLVVDKCLKVEAAQECRL